MSDLRTQPEAAPEPDEANLGARQSRACAGEKVAIDYVGRLRILIAEKRQRIWDEIAAREPRTDPSTHLWLENVDMDEEALEHVRLLNEELEQLAMCAGYVIDAARENGDDPIELALKSHYGFEGMEFSVMRAKWLIGEKDAAIQMHPFVGEHSPEKCPVCVGDKAFASPLVAEAT